MLSGISGVSSLENVTDDHTIPNAVQKNHLPSLRFGFAPIHFSDHTMMNSGMKNAGIPKHLLMKKSEMTAPRLPQLF